MSCRPGAVHCYWVVEGEGGSSVVHCDQGLWEEVGQFGAFFQQLSHGLEVFEQNLHKDEVDK